MGQIKPEVESGHLLQFPQERRLLRPFLTCFDITWAKQHRAYNTDLSIYFLSPERFIKEQFGFDQEIILAISHYKSIQPRSIQAIDSAIDSSPAKGRVDQWLFFIITNDPDGVAWITEYRSKNPQSRIPIALQWDEVSDASDSWYLRNKLAAQLFARDLFDYKLPIDSDLFFFGRDAVVAEFIDATKQSQNRGLFGLRKTGKTSILFKIKRLSERDAISTFYYDCKAPSIRNLKWSELLSKIVKDINEQFRIPPNKKSTHPSDDFTYSVKIASKQKKLCLIFDEIEYISPLSTLDTHWKTDFIPFWQTLWATQSEHRQLSFIIAGVNPSCAEIDTLDGVQNPMFGIVKTQYLIGFKESELRSMLLYFGKRMGLKFDENSVRYLFTRYGGHPLLTRMACSHYNNHLLSIKSERPITINQEQLRLSENERDEEIVFYCKHIVSELKQFYPIEYEMLEMLSSGNLVDFLYLAQEPEYTRHLRGYGLLEFSNRLRPSLKIPVVSKYILSETARERGASSGKYVVQTKRREEWLQGRLKSITQEMRTLEKVRENANLPHIYGPHSYPEAEKFCNCKLVTDEAEFFTFINSANRSLVEPIDNFGKKSHDPQYFWSTFKKAYPDLWRALARIKIYRNNAVHSDMNNSAQHLYQAFIQEDLDERSIDRIDDPYFRLQQAVLDGLVIAIQYELVRYS
ncbi:hypothetical protein [Methyloraptor flagellatus]|uniref:ATP-binding protein n=1 Tax=Methyloraptor flagellatus TaxID=3162530 RepID=A0AAU7X505_9HYPH